MFQDESELWISALTQTNPQLLEKFMGSGLNVEFWINSYKEQCSRSFANFFWGGLTCDTRWFSCSLCST